MKLWMSAEMMADVADDYRAIRKSIESEINAQLEQLGGDLTIKEWTFIAIILEKENQDYPEVAKSNKKGTDFEFRLKIDHQNFLDASKPEKTMMILDSLNRAVSLMADMDIPASEVAKIRQSIERARGNLTT